MGSKKRKAESAAAPVPESTKKARLRGRARAEAVTKPGVISGPSSGKPAVLSPGVKLVREYKGNKVVVTVMEGNRFEWDGRFFKSLSALATAVSGQHCSGPAFFGLRGRKPTAAKGKK